MYQFILIISGIVLFPQANALTCYECDDTQPCGTKETECITGLTRCGSFRMIVFMGNSKLSEIVRGSCVVPQQCIQGSVNFGLARTVITASCCETDRCNAQEAPTAPKTNPNGKKCYRCDGPGQCTGTLNCDNDEDYCITATMKEVKVGTMKGCATKSMCQSMNTSGVDFVDFRCCQGNYCNSSSAIEASLLLLTSIIISLFFLSN